MIFFGGRWWQDGKWLVFMYKLHFDGHFFPQSTESRMICMHQSISNIKNTKIKCILKCNFRCFYFKLHKIAHNSDILEEGRSFSHLENTTHRYIGIIDLQPIPQNPKLFQKSFYAQFFNQ